MARTARTAALAFCMNAVVLCSGCISVQDRESFIELKDVLKVDIDGNIIGKEKSKRLIDAFIEDCKAGCILKGNAEPRTLKALNPKPCMLASCCSCPVYVPGLAGTDTLCHACAAVRCACLNRVCREQAILRDCSVHTIWPCSGCKGWRASHGRQSKPGQSMMCSTWCA